MTAPALQKTWDHNIVNLHITADGTQDNGTSDGTNDRKELFLAMVNGWLDAPGSTITVTRSCDGVSAADSNLWTDKSKLRWNNSVTATRAWIALAHTSLSSHGTTYMLIDLVNNSGHDGSMIEVWVSPDAPFTGGSPTAQPTAANQQQFKDGNTTTISNFGGYWGAGVNNATPRAFVLQQQTSDDGQVSRSQIWLNGVCIGWWTWERMRLPQGLTYDFICSVFGTGSDTVIAPEREDFYDVDNYVFGLKDDKTRVRYKYTMHDSRNTKVHDVFIGRREDGSVGVSPVGLWCDDGSWLFKWGDLFDLYWGQHDGAPTTHLPTAAVRDWLKIYDLVIYWGDNNFVEVG